MVRVFSQNWLSFMEKKYLRCYYVPNPKVIADVPCEQLSDGCLLPPAQWRPCVEEHLSSKLPQVQLELCFDAREEA